MIGISDRDYAAIRFEAFADDVLDRRSSRCARPLEVDVLPDRRAHLPRAGAAR